jgi:hypothetical protein
MDELFQIEPTKSPKLKWMERHFLTVQITTLPMPNVYQCKHGMTVVAHGETHDDALCNAARKLNIKLWNEE